MPFLSVCIPHFSRHQHLIQCLLSFEHQSFDDFEVCISDDSPDTPERIELLDFIRNSKLNIRYCRNSSPLRYDANLRSAISLSTGKYLLLFGNDDQLAHPQALHVLAQRITAHERCGVAICNFRELSTGESVHRIREDAIVAGNARNACTYFRDVAFVSGVVLHGDSARQAHSESLDGTEMYQMYLLARIMTNGLPLIRITDILVEKDISIPGSKVDSFRQPHQDDRRFIVRTLPLCRILETLSVGIGDAVPTGELRSCLSKAARGLYSFTFPYWILEYRRHKPWRFSAGLALGLSPLRTMPDPPCGNLMKWRFLPRFLLGACVALTIPVAVFDRLRPTLYRTAKSHS